MKFENIIYMSDPHLDFYIPMRKQGNRAKLERAMRTAVNNHLGTEGDFSEFTAVIAGDLGHSNIQTVAYVKALKERVKYVVFTHGNHDMYLINQSQANKYKYNSFNRIKELAEMIAPLKDIHFLNGTTVELDGIKFGGLPMWYNLKNKRQVENWINSMNDCRLIMQDGMPRVLYAGGYTGRVIKPTFQSIEFYKRQIASLSTMKCDVLITHVCPTTIPDECRGHQHRHSPYNCFYESDTGDMVESTNAKYCIFGHTHTEMVFKDRRTEYHCNPFGYPGEHLIQKFRRLK